MLYELFPNYYSLLIPFVNIFLSCFIYIIYLNYRKFQSLLWVSHAIACSTLALIAFTLAIIFKNNFWVFIGYFLFFIVTMCVTKAVFIRFGLALNLLYISIITTLGTIGLYYYSFIVDNLDARVNVWTLTVMCIAFHRFIQFFRIKVKNNLDILLKAILFFIPTIAFLLSVFTDSPYNHPDPTAALFTLAWLETIVMLLGISIFLLITGTTLHESLNQLNVERNTDTLTGILNRRAFLEKLEEVSEQYQNSEHTIVIFDIDHFKKINDQYGHEIGDLALQHIAVLISSSIRSTDIFARIGGEEFIILLPNLSQHNALKVVERFRKLIESTPFHINQNEYLQITASFGISCLTHGKTLKQAFNEADKLLYKAKTLGRNNIQFI